ncbi:LysE/ArgO family amino acid transporter [Achromobacter deleyi]|uniref:LysE/ArgO family amino acid transporter n=1 Tax=Achromobacter deleyi TaxID=1353891 RepID=UPI001491D5C5|nr:LysE/ArgO family amino acid transporter [Achromobacter deleyi]QVQ26831.1 amino acid transporter [Achromobacter deleyi]UIP22407.1 LysE/ArgO family amino acid transporter [Achromobacter deleyi]
MATAFIPGFLLGLSLIVAIGAQNAFVLRQGLRQEHVFAVCLACALSDAVLIAAGVAGFGMAVDALPWLEPAMRYGGALFLFAYAARSLHSALRRRHGHLAPSSRHAQSRYAALATCLALTWLNPHVYLDTVVLLGSISSQYEGRKTAFALGAIAASFAFFFALGYGARLLRPVFASARAWRALDACVGILMIVIGVKLVM